MAIRAYAAEQMQVVPLISRERRIVAARFGGVLAALLVLWHWPTGGGIAGAVALGMIAYVLIHATLADFFPTPPIRIARMACERGVHVVDLWPEDAPERRDYYYGWRAYELWLRRRGRGGWIRVS